MPFLHLSPFCRHGRQAEKAKILAFCRERRPRRSVYVAACFYGGRTKSLLVSLGIHLLRKWTPPPPLRANNHCGAKWEGPHELAVAIVGIGTDSRGRLSLQRIGEDVKFCSFSSLKVLGGCGGLLSRSPPRRSPRSPRSPISIARNLRFGRRTKSITVLKRPRRRYRRRCPASRYEFRSARPCCHRSIPCERAEAERPAEPGPRPIYRRRWTRSQDGRC